MRVDRDVEAREKLKTEQLKAATRRIERLVKCNRRWRERNRFLTRSREKAWRQVERLKVELAEAQIEAKVQRELRMSIERRKSVKAA